MTTELLRPTRSTIAEDFTEEEFSRPTPPAVEETIRVIHGTHDQTQPLAGRTVREIRAEMAERLNLGPQTSVFVDGDPVDDESQVVVAGQQVQFLREAGEKGVFHSQEATPCLTD